MSIHVVVLHIIIFKLSLYVEVVHVSFWNENEAVHFTLKDMYKILRKYLKSSRLLLIEPRHEKTCFCHVHPRSLTSTFVVRCLDSIIPLVAIAKISRTSSAEQASLSLTWSETPKTVFFVTWLNFIFR